SSRYSYCYGRHRYLHSFPTRRSSDLVESVERTVDYFDSLTDVERNRMTVGFHSKFIDFTEHTIDFTHAERHRIASFGFTKESDNTCNRFDDVRDFTRQVGFDHHIARKIDPFFCDFLAIANLNHLFSRNEYLRNVIGHPEAVDFGLDIILDFILLTAYSPDHIPFLHVCLSHYE